MLFYKADTYQEQYESNLKKNEKSNENDLMPWMTYVFFKNVESTLA